MEKNYRTSNFYFDIKNNLIIIVPIILLMIFFRFITIIPNFTPIISLILFLTLLVKNIRLCIFLIMFAQIFVDYYIGFYDSIFFVYRTYILLAILSHHFIAEIKLIKILNASIVGPVIFYIITNFGVWFTMDLYSNTLSGLITCYVAGIPFLKTMILSTIIFSMTLFALFSLIKKNSAKTLSQSN